MCSRYLNSNLRLTAMSYRMDLQASWSSIVEKNFSAAAAVLILLIINFVSKSLLDITMDYHKLK